MAKNNVHLTEEERKSRVLQIADYIIMAHASTRSTAKYFSESLFPISNCTVHTYIKKWLPKYDLNRYEKVMTIINENAPKTIEDLEVKIRTYNAALLLLQGMTIQEIAETLQSTFDTIYRDLTERMPKIDREASNIVLNVITQHRLANLKQYEKSVPQELIEQVAKR